MCHFRFIFSLTMACFEALQEIFQVCSVFVFSLSSLSGVRIYLNPFLIYLFKGAMDTPHCIATPPDTIQILLWTTVAVFGVVYTLLGN